MMLRLTSSVHEQKPKELRMNEDGEKIVMLT